MAKWPWIERRFTFDYPITKHPDIVERFAGLPARIEERCAGLTREQLTWTGGASPLRRHPHAAHERSESSGLPFSAPPPAGEMSRSDRGGVPTGWSIQENVGHLLALESLFDGRLDDYAAGKPILRPADMENLATRQANYNSRGISEILTELRAARAAQVAKLERLDESDFARVAEHPRLKMPMRLIDAVCFVCEHDDYHMARIAELRRANASQVDVDAQRSRKLDQPQ